MTVDAVAVAEEIPWGGIPGKRFRDLLGGPSRRRRVRDIEMDDPSPIVCQDDEDEQHLERDRGNSEEVNGD